ncbi:MAG: class I SAM-dependent methyltransferase [Alphaproteobacteria bacterium]|nr:class I SAM-dependent methyltransferase [Alphaproteobacteria bacterium SS10]
MSDWGEGYVTATDYTTNFYSPLAPESIDQVALFMGKRPARKGKAFRYFELGCGTGLTCILLAATHPEAEFVANDFNPGHVAIAHEIIEALGLTNITITDRSFAEVLADTHEPYDYIIAHGIYTWVSHENREYVTQFIGKNLKVGGYSLVSYNCAGGWSQHDILNVMFKSMLKGKDLSEPNLPNQIFGEISQLFSLDEGLLQSNSPTVQFMNRLGGGEHDPRYVMHEFGNDTWEPVYSHTPIEHMAGKKLDYIGQSNVLDNIPVTGVPAKLHPVLEGRPKLQREMLVDFAMARIFRSDVYVKGAINQTPGAHRAELDKAKFFAAYPAERYDMAVKVPTGQIGLDEKACRSILGFAGVDGCTGAELRQHCETLGLVDDGFREIVGILVGVGYLRHAADEPAPADHMTNINKRLCAMALDGQRSINYLLSPRTRSTLKVTMFDQLFFHTGETADLGKLVEAALGEMTARNIQISDAKGNPLASDQLHKMIEGNAEAYMRDTLPVLHALHIVAANT